MSLVRFVQISVFNDGNGDDAVYGLDQQGRIWVRWEGRWQLIDGPEEPPHDPPAFDLGVKS